MWLQHAYILVTGSISIMRNSGHGVAFNNYAPFIKCITKIDGKTIDVVGQLDLVIPMYSLIEYSSSYSETTGTLWFYLKMK